MTLIGFFLLYAFSGPTFVGPSPSEFASALASFSGKPVKVADIRRLSCKGFGTNEPTEAECSWQQNVGKKWKQYSTHVAVDGRGWHLVDEPSPKR